MDTKPNSKFVFSVILVCVFLESHVSLAADTISENQSLSGDQTIASAGGMFELGFFKPGQLSNYYIGIWYSKQVVSEMTVVWVANREIPVSDRFSSVLTILDGNLVLLNMSKNPVWSTDLNSTTNSGSVQAVLLDSGNLVLKAGSSNNTLEPLWQSFDHPTDTLLPGGKFGFNKITNHSQILTSWKNLEDPAPGLYSLHLAPDEGDSCIYLWNRSRQYWTSGPWNESLRNFNMVPELRLFNDFNYSSVRNENESYLTYSINNPKIVTRSLMTASGQVQQLTWLEASKQWNVFWSQPRQCDVYAFCGAFSSCKPTSLNYCKCLKGFEPNRQSDWDLQIYSGGCSRRTSVKCGNATGDGFLEKNSKSLLENSQNERALSFESCRSACLNECQCTAYVYDSSNGCSIWHGDVLNLQEFEANDGDGRILYIRAAASDIEKKRNKRMIIHVLLGAVNLNVILMIVFFSLQLSPLIAIVSTITGLLVVIFGYFLWKKTLGTKSKVAAGGEMNDAELPIFGLRAIIAATNNFAEANKLGEGGFGPVYKVTLPLGYMSPEYARYGHFSEKLDVFSFGVVLLEIVSGKKNAAFYLFEHSPTLAGWAWDLWKDGRGMEVIDESVRETCRLDEALKCIHVGFLCVQEAPADRPTMSLVIRMLQGNESTSLPPFKEPAFSTHKNSSPVCSSQTPTIFSHNTVTMSLPEGR
ncbi:hypothetical protein DVH24_032230 [Malus domestica]|uniref:Receptor-like serine/threonine-protein kinase n=1 Tax=Malus domestica TaxID=3750 RepID=A0A498J7U0_MALDO|nr:hypothetical protein DVH24_032230 [Malus domestica]